MSTMHARVRLKGKQGVEVEFERYRTKLHTYICSYVCIASTERRYGSTGLGHVITERSIL